MSLAGFAAGYGNISEGEQDYATKALENTRRMQGNMDNARKLRQMREAEAERNARTAAIQAAQAPQARSYEGPELPGYAPVQPAPPVDAGTATAKRNSNAAHAQLAAMRAAQAPYQPAVNAKLNSLSAHAQLPPAEPQYAADRRAIGSAAAGYGDVLLGLPRAIVNVGTGAGAGIANLGGRVANIVAGRQVLPTDMTGAQLSYTGLSDRVGGPPTPATSPGRVAELRAQDAARAARAAPEAAVEGQGAAPTGPATARAQQWDAARTPYDAAIQSAAVSAGVDPVIFKRLIGSESSFNPAATNGVAFGIAQAYKTNIGNGPGQIPMEAAMDPNRALPWAANLFKQYLDKTGGDYNKAILLYKGAKFAPGIAAMTPVASEILSGLGRAAASVIPSAQAAPAPAQAQAQAQAPAPALIGSPVNMTPQQAGMAQERMARMAQDRQMMLQLMNATTLDPDRRLQLRASIDAIDDNIAEAQMSMATAMAANGNGRALTGLVQALSNDTGVPMTVQRTSDGMVVITRAGRASPPMSMSAAAGQIHGLISARMRAEAAARQAAYDKSYATHSAESAAKLPGQLALEGVKGEAKQQEQLQKAVLDAAAEATKLGYAQGEYKIEKTDAGQVFLLPKNGPPMEFMRGGEDKFGTVLPNRFEPISLSSRIGN